MVWVKRGGVEWILVRGGINGRWWGGMDEEVRLVYRWMEWLEKKGGWGEGRGEG